MNPYFQQVIVANDADRRGLFLQTATRLGTTAQNVEKDFWVCWTLDALFNGMASNGPRLLFKGGTSLSKAFGLIDRFSEDIDITVFRDNLGQGCGVQELSCLSGKKRRSRLDEIRMACQAHIAGPLMTQLMHLAASVMPSNSFNFELDPADKDHQTVLFWYPAVTSTQSDYVRSAVKIEAGAKSALDPHASVSVTPFIAPDLPDFNLTITGITTVKPERTFWDKVIILHGLRQWHERRHQLRHGGQRVSRHYYDLHQLMQLHDQTPWSADHVLALDCAQHARLFFGSTDLGLDVASPGSFTLVPDAAMRQLLTKDYAAMAGMIFGNKPKFETVLQSVEKLERLVNFSQTTAERAALKCP
jgi:hypothetical protein